MDLTKQYVEWKFDQIDPADIIKIVDDTIMKDDGPVDKYLDLSLFFDGNGTDFESKLIKFVKFPIPECVLLPIVIKGLGKIKDYDDNGLIGGLLTARSNWGFKDKYDELYYSLDHYMVEEREYSSIEMIKKFISEWIIKHDTQIINDGIWVKNEPAA